MSIGRVAAAALARRRRRFLSGRKFVVKPSHGGLCRLRAPFEESIENAGQSRAQLLWLLASVGEALKFFAWAYKDGAGMAAELDYVPLPAPLITQVQKTWTTQIASGGKPVWSGK